MSLTMRFGAIIGPSVSIARQAFPPRPGFERIHRVAPPGLAARPNAWNDPPLHRFHDPLHHLLRVRKQHHGVVAEEELVLDAGVARAHAAL